MTDSWWKEYWVISPHFSQGVTDLACSLIPQEIFLGFGVLRLSRSLFQTRLYRFHPWNRTFCVHAVVSREYTLLFHSFRKSLVESNLRRDICNTL